VIRNDRTASSRRRRGSIFVEYLLLLTIVGIGAIAGITTLRNALFNEMVDLANAIGSLIGDPDNYDPPPAP